MADARTTSRPVRAEVAASYDLGVEGYITSWSSVILPPAEAVVRALEMPPGARVLDVGGGTGALVPSIRAAAPDTTVIAIDASAAMLRAAQARTGVPAVHADALRLPVRGTAVDVVVLAYVLFHLSDPGHALREAALALRPGGRLGTVTWGREASLPAYAVWDEALTRAGAPVLPTRRMDVGLDTPDGIRELLGASGFEPLRVWRQELHRQWTPDTYWELVTGSGQSRTRLQALEEGARRTALTGARERLATLEPAAFAWSGEVVCAAATRAGPRP